MRPENYPSRPVTLLLSREGARHFGSRIHEVLKEVPHRLLQLEDQPGTAGAAEVDIAFLTRDVTGRADKTEQVETLMRFFDIMRASSNLRWMQTHTAGADRPIYTELRKRNVVVTTASGTNAVSVAQMAFTGLLLLARRFPELMESQRRRQWAPLLGDRAPRDLKGQTAVVVGLGPIGMEIARLLKAIDMHVIGVRRSDVPAPLVDETVCFTDLDRVLKRADWLLLSCPLTDQTRGLLNHSTIGLLPHGARVINVSRGNVIVEKDLIQALRNGQLGGAYLDVLVKEPLDTDSELWDMPNVILTPHTAGHTQGHYAAVGDLFLENLGRWRDGKPLINVIP